MSATEVRGGSYVDPSPQKIQNTYQEFFHKISCLRKEFLWEIIFQLNNLLKYKIFISVNLKKMLLFEQGFFKSLVLGVLLQNNPMSLSPPRPALTKDLKHHIFLSYGGSSSLLGTTFVQISQKLLAVGYAMIGSKA